MVVRVLVVEDEPDMAEPDMAEAICDGLRLGAHHRPTPESGDRV
jgi:hypothetical protein